MQDVCYMNLVNSIAHHDSFSSSVDGANTCLVFGRSWIQFLLGFCCFSLSHARAMLNITSFSLFNYYIFKLFLQMTVKSFLILFPVCSLIPTASLKIVSCRDKKRHDFFPHSHSWLEDCKLPSNVVFMPLYVR